MKTEDVVKQLAGVLPGVTTLFSKQIAVSSLVFSGGIATATTAVAHGLKTNQFVTVSGAFSPTLITSINRIGTVATAVTTTDHDLTFGFQDTVQIEGATETEYNGTHELLSVPNRRTFTFSVQGSPATPATGSPQLLENRLNSYNGRHQITVIDTTNFTFPLTTSPGSPATGSPVVHTQIRVSRSITAERALAAYTEQKQNNLWAFVVADDPIISRDRGLLTDAVSTLSPSDYNHIRQIENFSVYVVIPATNSIAGGAEMDLVEDIRILLYKSLVGVKLPSNLVNPRQYIVVPSGDEFFGYNEAYYVHRFTFQTARDIAIEDFVDDKNSVAFRNIEIQTLNDFEETVLTTTVDLDDEPL